MSTKRDDDDVPHRPATGPGPGTRGAEPHPEQALGVWFAVAAVTLGTGPTTARRVLRTPAVRAVASAA
ncbi:hypothetical protein ACIP4Q_06070 [Streptomyces massasporeus]